MATERYLRNELPADDRLVFEAKLLVNDELRANTLLHRVVHRLVALYHRRKVKAQIGRLHERLFSDPVNAELRDCVHLFKS